MNLDKCIVCFSLSRGLIKFGILKRSNYYVYSCSLCKSFFVKDDTIFGYSIFIKDDIFLGGDEEDAETFYHDYSLNIEYEFLSKFKTVDHFTCHQDFIDLYNKLMKLNNFK